MVISVMHRSLDLLCYLLGVDCRNNLGESIATSEFTERCYDRANVESRLFFDP